MVFRRKSCLENDSSCIKMQSRCAEDLEPEILKCHACLSICRSVRPFVCRSKNHYCISSKLCRYVYHVMGVCCLVIAIDIDNDVDVV